LDIGFGSEQIEGELRKRLPEIGLKYFFGRETLRGKNSAECKNQRERADKAGA
jgi:hypothetical protein